MPADDLTDPAPATSFAHLDATTVLSRSIAEKGIYPAVDPLDSTSRMLDPRIVGEEHYQVARMAAKSQRIVNELFAAFAAEPRLLPPQYQAQAKGDPHRTIADYIAGMTDRYAYAQHALLVKNRSIENESLQLFP